MLALNYLTISLVLLIQNLLLITLKNYIQPSSILVIILI